MPVWVATNVVSDAMRMCTFFISTFMIEIVRLVKMPTWRAAKERCRALVWVDGLRAVTPSPSLSRCDTSSAAELKFVAEVDSWVWLPVLIESSVAECSERVVAPPVVVSVFSRAVLCAPHAALASPATATARQPPLAA